MDGGPQAETPKPISVDALPWEGRFPGRFEAEMDSLKAQALEYRIDHDRLARGQLAVELTWPLDAETAIDLLAVYPDGFPYWRPQVFLKGGLENDPIKHVSPEDGNLCLLGRDTRQWLPSLTLGQLLSDQLVSAVQGSEDEDPQAEPIEVWWNSRGTPGSYCLVDSTWSVGEAREGTLKLRYRLVSVSGAGGTLEKSIQAYVSEVRAADGSLLQTWQGPLPKQFEEACHEIDIPWVKVAHPIVPKSNFSEQLEEIRRNHACIRTTKTHRLAQGQVFHIFAILAEGEVSFGKTGLTWAMPLYRGHIQAFKAGGRKPVTLSALPVLRAGMEDLGFRVPAVNTLRNKRVLLVGAGAIGAPIALEMARSGCSFIDLIEYDRLEPGNTVRWPVGAEFWGSNKTLALRSAIERSYPGCTVVDHQHMLGSADLRGTSDDVILDPLLGVVDLVIDATASHSATAQLSDRCREVGKPFITVSATPKMTGGFVSRHTAAGGCYICLLNSWHHGDLPPPEGWGEDEELAQPAGCAERTFFGASYDLQELSLQAVRLAVATLADEGTPRSIVQTLRLPQDQSGLPPTWRSDELLSHRACSCHVDQ